MKYKTQELFDIAVGGLLKQGVQSFDSKIGCMYHTKGLKCAMGMLIPDNIYKEAMENTVISGLLDEYVEVRALFSVKDDDLLGDLQYIHDSSLPENWHYRFKKLAQENKLKWEFGNTVE